MFGVRYYFATIRENNFTENIMPKPKNAIPIFHGRQWPVGLTNASKRLNCSVGHLHQVLTGKRSSPRVKDGYQALVNELKRRAA